MEKRENTMTTSIERPVQLSPFPDHTQLPDEDGTFVFTQCGGAKNFQEHPQSLILTDSIGSILEKIHPDSQYAIGQDCGIYWRETDPPEKGAEAPGTNMLVSTYTVCTRNPLYNKTYTSARNNIEMIKLETN
jgi:hypothetical protein